MFQIFEPGHFTTDKLKKQKKEIRSGFDFEKLNQGKGKMTKQFQSVKELDKYINQILKNKKSKNGLRKKSK